MKINNLLSIILKWLPSLIITLFFIPNALDKILNANQSGKIIANPAVMITTGIFLLIATTLFLYHKTVVIGTSLLSFYMTFIVFVHIYKGKPYEIAILIVMTTVFAAYLRKPEVFK